MNLDIYEREDLISLFILSVLQCFAVKSFITLILLCGTS